MPMLDLPNVVFIEAVCQCSTHTSSWMTQCHDILRKALCNSRSEIRMTLVWIRNCYKYCQQRCWRARLSTALCCQCPFLKKDDISHLRGPCWCLWRLYQHVRTHISPGVFEELMRQNAAPGCSSGLWCGRMVVTHEVHRPFKQPELCRWRCWQTEIAFTELESQGHRQLFVDR